MAVFKKRKCCDCEITNLFALELRPSRPVPARAVQLPPAAAAAPHPPLRARARRTPPPTRRPSRRTPGFAPRHVRQLHRPRQQATILREYNDDTTWRPVSVGWMRDAQSSGQESRLRDPVRRVRRHRGRVRRKGSAGARRDRRRRLCRRRCHRDCSGRRRCRRGHTGRRCVTSPAVVVVWSSWSPALQSARPSSAQCEKQNLRFVHEHKKMVIFVQFADFLFLCGAVARDDRTPCRWELACVA